MPDTQHTDTPRTDTRHRLTGLLKQLGVAALYALLVRIEHSHFESDAVIGSFEPASGLALAVLLIFGKRYAGCIFFGALLANTMQAPFMEAAAISSGDTLQALCGAWLLTRNARFDRALRSLNDYLRLISLGGAISVGIGALIAMTILLISGFATPETYFRELLDWWMGDMLGIILITPLILVCWQAKNDWRGAKRIAETVLLLGLTFLAGQIVFLGWFHAAASLLDHVAKGYWIFLCIVWVAVRSGTRGTVIALVMAAIQGLLGAYHGVGFFADDIAQTQLVNYWFYTLTLSVVGMALATYISGQKQSEEALHRSEMKFRTLYDSTSEAVTLMDEKGFFDCNPAALAMFGCATKEEFSTKHPGDISPPQQPDGTNSLLLANRHIATAMEKGSHRFEWVCNRLDTGKTFVVDTLLSAVVLDGRTVLQAVARDITEQKRAEDELQRFFNLVPDLVCIASTDGRFLKINRAWQTTLGYTEQEILATPFLDFIHPDDREATTKEVGRQMAGEATIRFSNRYRCKDGGYKWLEWDATPAVGKTLLFASARDITERRQSEAILAESESRFREIFNAVSDAIFIHDAETGRIIDVNRRMCEMYGFTHEEALACDVTDLSAGTPPYSTADAAEKIRLAHTMGQQTFDWLARAHDGHLFWVEVSLRFALIDNQQRILALVRDITERKHIEDELRLTKERYDFATAVGKVGTWDWNPLTGALIWSDETFRLMDIAPGSVTPSYELYLGLVHPEDRELLGNAVQAALHDKKSYDLDCRIVLGNMKEIVCHVTGKVEFNAEYKPIRMLGTIQDITERKATEQRLHELSTHILEVREEEKARIAREIHDELGGTLTALKIDAYWLSRRLSENREAAPIAMRVESMSRRIDNAISATRHIIDDMRPAILDDLGLLAAIEWQAAEFSKNTGIECAVSCVEDEANLDKQRSIALFRILQEALTNVSRHSGASGVEIKFHHGENEIILIVSDNGCGMPENHMASKKSYGMSGMTERVEQLGGKIIFDSPQGGGFTVAATLPLRAEKGNSP